MAELTGEQRDELVADLVALRELIAGQLQLVEGSDRPVTLDQQLVGRVSRIDAIQQQQMAKANVRQLQARFKLVESAIQRAADGDYGYCLECDEPIGFPRLKVRPDSLLCVECQDSRERLS